MHKHSDLPTNLEPFELVETVEAPDQLLRHAGVPIRTFVSDHGQHLEEPLLLIGWVVAPREKRDVLSLYGIELRHARWNSTTRRWERCLFSEETARMLEALRAESQFPYAFEAVLSEGGRKWKDALARGDADVEIERGAWGMVPHRSEKAPD